MKRVLETDDFIEPVHRKKSHLEGPKAPYYNFGPLVESEKHLRKHAKRNARGEWTIDFSSRDATLALTCAILKHHFRLSLFLPSGHLVPTIPNRVQYISWAAALLGTDAREKPLVLLDIGTGPSCIYPMLGSRMFPRWSFIATDTDHEAVTAARRNCQNNSLPAIKIIHTGTKSFLPDVVLNEKPVLTLCNPPFHEILPKKEVPAGTEAQLKTDGGEFSFLCKLAKQSSKACDVVWFTSLIGRKVDLPKFVTFLRSKHVRAPIVKTTELSQGGRTTRWAVAWSFGEEISTIRISTNSNSKWRCAIHVKPGRKYANRLDCQDILNVACSVFHKLGWEQLPIADHEMISNPYTAVLRDSSEERQGPVELHVSCLPKSPTGEIEVLFKINRKGAMSPESVRELGTSVCAKMSDILNGCPSYDAAP